ncbi:MAG: ABC transporter permease [Tissierellia bacterium]|nr:ABC transporter permease [Tissierellia bacterium]
MDIIVSVMSAALRLTTPIAFATLGSVVMELAGINALATEGIMLAGAFGAVMGSWYFTIPWMGVLCAVLFAVAVALLRSYLCIRHGANHTVSGIGLNMLLSGFSAMMLKIVWNMDGKSDVVNNLNPWSIPIIDKIPGLGDIVGRQNPLVYLALPALLLVWVLLYRTSVGLRLMTVGENPEVLTSLGLSVSKYRYLATAFGAALIGIGGAYLSIGQLSFFSQDMTSGRGYMALAACVFGRWNPAGAFAGALLFGFADSLQMHLQSSVKYTQFIQMIPYVLTILVLSSFVNKSVHAPAASGKPFEEQE